MPTYRVENDQGQVLKIQGDQPPTEQELDNIFSEYNSLRQAEQSELQQAPKEGLSLQDRALQFGIDPFGKSNQDIQDEINEQKNKKKILLK